ncbi:hypothetical protein LOC68_09770 [Blastopirellula sp. JC732]|uniref:Uncharacterized protein n=1 Tax=Blastopirellula sediminis TaxID=2894196 RepID=A0A9X1MLY1_9BACT|nr:hypothetical protein [Blastopirellula sediminis]MCC9608538.1 hypothetical protein [Blastopirellula sediminis]MCC9628685.1 hypothetical protein [Blastopirellula sediminis]
MKRESAAKTKTESLAERAATKTCPALYQVVAECQSERDQRQLYIELKAKGYRCRLLNL